RKWKPAWLPLVARERRYFRAKCCGLALLRRCGVPTSLRRSKLEDFRLRYVSTRGQAPALGFEEVLLAGLARDGGLYVPETWPTLDNSTVAGFAGQPYHKVAERVMTPFVDKAIDGRDFAAIVAEAYAGFDHVEVAPLLQLAANDWGLELFHGPTLAFKDFALQLLGRLLDHVLRRRA